jgi:hypothetical protein
MILLKGNKTIQISLASLQEQKTTLGHLPQACWHTQEQIFLLLFIGVDYKMHSSSISFQC